LLEGVLTANGQPEQIQLLAPAHTLNRERHQVISATPIAYARAMMATMTVIGIDKNTLLKIIDAQPKDPLAAHSRAKFAQSAK
jgi:hypothetical protein